MLDSGLLRIGELSRRSGVSPELLRAWERRYQLLRPARSQGGLRLYSLDDLERVREMRRHLASGLAAAEPLRLTPEEATHGLSDACRRHRANAVPGKPGPALGMQTVVPAAIEKEPDRGPDPPRHQGLSSL